VKRRASVQKFQARPLPQIGSIKPVRTASATASMRVRTRSLAQAFSRYLRNVNSGHPGSITTVHADSAALAFEQLTLLVRESEGGRDLPRDDIRALLHLLIDVVVQMKKVDGVFRLTEVWHEPARKRQPGG
jgi:hypothetical protein